MKFTQDVRREGRQAEAKNRFGRFRELVEKNAKVALAAFSLTFAVQCSGGTGKEAETDGGDNEGGAGGAQDTGTGGAGGSTSVIEICSVYGQGDPHRMTFGLGDEAALTGDGHRYKLNNITVIGEELRAVFNHFEPGSSEADTLGFEAGDTGSYISPTLGKVRFQLCEMTPNECTLSSGDQDCTATLAASSGWTK